MFYIIRLLAAWIAEAVEAEEFEINAEISREPTWVHEGEPDWADYRWMIANLTEIEFTLHPYSNGSGFFASPHRVVCG